MAFVFIGLSGTAFNHDTQKEIKLGQTMQIGPYTLLLRSFDTKPEKNYTAERMIVEVLRDNKPLMMLYREKPYKSSCQERFFSVGSVPTLFCHGIQPNRLNVHS
jgi:cytochrome c biogenesis factor